LHQALDLYLKDSIFFLQYNFSFYKQHFHHTDCWILVLSVWSSYWRSLFLFSKESIVIQFHECRNNCHTICQLPQKNVHLIWFQHAQVLLATVKYWSNSVLMKFAFLYKIWHIASLNSSLMNLFLVFSEKQMRIGLQIASHTTPYSELQWSVCVKHNKLNSDGNTRKWPKL